ncbi:MULTISPECIES: Stk1 family PASTA domain-containing Ser/Thr kinase [unclassified Crossiella]|uniref:Stk1 family PASTA domain-containing Ser/Thr kinase n=1 Tax=unclassified Crossiella TaxID=2620835 RepID=UPI001FFEBF3F|nr:MULTISPECIES: Stk1 family PASTA domain-containing Ser/Thr kinase [unclassified Crossiella]MCK2245137.1 Stk1 family PASTA domain-containing Ser/Thr kinase [Crossiella sp. S99.2]MCK2258790.1 Stk1 family PASTA domain-containing Ser/Thr kinase [Crossiella sp. S99.1]
MSTPRLLSNRYELGETLGYGGMSEVHKGRDVRLGRDVAVKVLRADLARDPQFQLRFRREAQNAASLNHPAIVAVYDTGETQTEYGPLPYIVMEFVDGKTLRDIVKTEGPLPARRAMEVMADVCAALDFSHRHGIVHRDVKPANVMITKSGAVKVMDFGIARAVHDGQAAVTQTAAVIGTAQYLSPEQARGEAVDARSDVYATGCVLFELMTGEPPFTGDSPVAVAYQHVREDPRSPSQVNPQVPAVLDAIVLKAMSKNPANRYQSAGEMRGDLVRVLSGQRPLAPMVMSEDERTSIVGGGGATQVIQGKHRPEALADGDDDEEERREKRRKTIFVAVAVALGVALLILLAFLLGPLLSGNSNGGGDTATVPKVFGKTEVQARQDIASAGFTKTPNLQKVVSKPEELNRVVSVNPAEGSAVKKDAEITLNIGSGPEEVTVPDLKGKTPSEAETMLTAAGLKLSANPTETAVEDSKQVGKVQSQTPSANTKAPKDSLVSITVGKAQDRVTVQNVIGQSSTAARGNLEGLGLRVEIKEVSSNKPQLEVVAQTPAGGTSVRPGATVTLSISKNDQFTMPNIEGMTESEARSKLQEFGWTGSFSKVEVSGSISEFGRIMDSKPVAGDPVSKTQTIQIQVGKLGGGSPTSTTPKGGG